MTRLLSPTRVEVLVALLAFTIAGALTFGSHVLHGGFYNDDWSYLVTYRYREDGGLWGALQAFTWLDFRPMGILYWPALYGALGVDSRLFLAWAVLLGVGVATMVFVVLRTLGMERHHAGIISALVLIFPAADSTRLWTNASISSVGILIYLAGLIVALRGLHATGRRALAWHAAAVLLYVASICTYEVTVGPIVLGVLLYGWRAGWGEALRRWSADVAATLATVALVTSNTWNETQPLKDQLRHAWDIADQSVGVFKASAVPFASPERALVVVPALVLIAIALAAWRLLPRGDPARGQLGRWLMTGVAGIVVIAAGYMAFVPAQPVYVPLAPGQFNRINNFAAIGYVVLLYSLVMLGVTLLMRVVPLLRGRGAILAGAACALIAAGWIDRIDAHKAQWDRAADLQAEVVAAVRTALPRPPTGSVVYTSDHEVLAAPGVQVFAAPWDLDGAIKLEWDDPTLAAYPLVEGTTFACGTASMAARNVNNAFGGPQGEQAASYGAAFVVDVRRAQAERIDDRAECQAASRRLATGA